MAESVWSIVKTWNIAVRGLARHHKTDGHARASAPQKRDRKEGKEGSVLIEAMRLKTRRERLASTETGTKQHARAEQHARMHAREDWQTAAATPPVGSELE